ncbi:MAG: WD40/YVTN/BNR-like repeat-containing protein [Fimbriimonadaceae bacterium]
MKLLFLATCLAAVAAAKGSWVVQPSGAKVQFRGISAVNEDVCWAAGSDGTYARTVDGANWTARQVPGAEKLVFRSVVAWDANRATLLAIGKGDASRIYHTDDGGGHWALQFTNSDPNAFYDAIQFWDPKHGIALSDPVDGKFRVLRTFNGGKTWTVLPNAGMPGALQGEGAFAASGTCLVVHGATDAWIATGGAAFSRVFHSVDRGMHWTVAQTPIPADKATAGIFGMAFRSGKEGVAVGGDYKSPDAGDATIAFTVDAGKSWQEVAPTGTPGHEGLFEGVGFADATTLVVLGPNRAKHASGVKSLIPAPGQPLTTSFVSDASDGLTGLHCCSFVPGIIDPIAQVGWAAGDNGLIAKWIWHP